MTMSKQAIATGKYQSKVGLISKSYKLRKEDVMEFAEACSKAGISQAAQITKMMSEFVEQTKKMNSH